MLSAGLDALFGGAPYGPIVTVLDALLIVIVLAAAAVTYIKTRKMLSEGQGSAATTNQRGLLAIGWLMVIVGAAGLLLEVSVRDGQPGAAIRLLGALAFLIFGVVCLWCRRSLTRAPAGGGQT